MISFIAGFVITMSIGVLIAAAGMEQKKAKGLL
jgi:hypothetical protein